MKQSNIKKQLSTIILALGATMMSSQAADPFSIHGITTDGSALDVTTSGSNFDTLLSQAKNASGPFAGFVGHKSVFDITYAGVPNAITATFTPSIGAVDKTLVVTFNTTGVTKTFTGPSRGNLTTQLQTFLTNDTSGTVGGFISSIQSVSSIGNLDGNPSAATAQFANGIFNQFAFGGLGASGTLGLTGDFEYSRFSTHGVSGSVFSMPLSYGIKLTDRVGLVVGIPLEEQTVGGAITYNSGLSLNVPIQMLAPASASNPWSWQLTPTVAAFTSISPDYSTFALLGNLGVSSQLTYDFHFCKLTMGNYLSGFTSMPTDLNGYTTLSGQQQWIMKNGFQVTAPIAENLQGYGQYIFTNFLNDAAVQNYSTLGAGVSYRIPNFHSASVWLGYAGDFGYGYSSNGIRVGTNIQF